MPPPELAHRPEVGRIQSNDHQEVGPLPTRLGDPSRRVDAAAIAVQQQRCHHRRIVRRLTLLARVARADLRQREMLPNQAHHQPRQMILANEVLHRGRKQLRLVDAPGAEALGNNLNQTSAPTSTPKSPLLRQAPSFWRYPTRGPHHLARELDAKQPYAETTMGSVADLSPPT